MGRIEFIPTTEKDRLTKFYVPMDEWEDIYPPDEYTGTAVQVKEALNYALEHINEINLDEFERKYGEDVSIDGYVEWFFDEWLMVTYEDMCPDINDFYDPKDTGHGYWDFY